MAAEVDIGCGHRVFRDRIRPMPELPEVETIVRRLADRLIGRHVSEIHLGRSDMVHGHPAPLCCMLGDRRITDVDRQGKWIRLCFDGLRRLDIHLGMSGRLMLLPCQEPIEAHTHLRLCFVACAEELRFVDPRRFGGLWLRQGDDDVMKEWIGQRPSPLGTDALAVTAQSFQRLLKRPRRIKSLLLDQTAIAGLGNIYCDEILHRAGIHPRTMACRLDASSVKALYSQMRKVLQAAIRAGGSTVRTYRTATNTSGKYQRRHKVYQRGRQPCGTCGTSIERLTVAGRSTFLCPVCQPESGD